MQLLSPDIWVIVESGLTGTIKQCEAIAYALNAPYRLIELSLPQPWRFLAPKLLAGLPTGLTPPWPKLVISGGRQGAAVALKIKRNNPDTKIVHLLNPHTNAAGFDLVIRPEHDNAPPALNLFTTTGAPCFFDAEQTTLDENIWRPKLAPYPMPRLGVLLGGPRSKMGWETSKIIALKRQLYRFLEADKGSLLLSGSRRTPKNILQKITENLPQNRIWIWDGTGANPYNALLSFSDAVAVTAESISMLSEVASLGKPLYSIALEPLPPKFAQFNRQLETRGIARLFTGTVDNWHYEPLNEAARVADHLKNLKLWS